MNIGFTTLANSLGFGLDFIIWIVITFGLLVFFAKDFKLGVVMTLFIEGALFAWYYYLYEAGFSFNYYLPLIVTFLALITLALSLLFVGGVVDKSGGYV